MSQNKLLTKEIVRHILISFGVTVSSNIPTNSLLSKECLTDKTVKIKYDEDEEYVHIVHAGQLLLSNNSKLRAAVVNLTIDSEEPEYCLCFRLDKLALHGLHSHSSTHYLQSHNDDIDVVLFKLYNELNKTWTDASIEVQAMVLGGIEKIVSYGLIWEPCNDFDDLYKSVLSLISI